MRNIFSVLLAFLMIAFSACTDNDSPETPYSGRSATYDLYAGYETGVPGTVEFRERKDLTVDIIIRLDDLEGDASLPAHLHFGNLSVADSPQAALLNNYNVAEGESITNIRVLADESEFTFERVADFDGSVKIHLGHTGDDYDVIVSAGNIGNNTSLGFNLQSIGICSPDLVE